MQTLRATRKNGPKWFSLRTLLFLYVQFVFWSCCFFHPSFAVICGWKIDGSYSGSQSVRVCARKTMRDKTNKVKGKKPKALRVRSTNMKQCKKKSAFFNVKMKKWLTNYQDYTVEIRMTAKPFKQSPPLQSGSGLVEQLRSKRVAQRSNNKYSSER